jgi:neopullulanase
MGIAMLITARGYPQIYYGTEIMLDGTPGDYQGHRYDFPGGWVTDKRNAFSQEGRTMEENEVFNYLKTLLNYRKNNPVLQSGKMKQFIPYDGVYVTFRYDANKTIMVIANNNNENRELKLDRFSEMLTNKSFATDIVDNKRFLLQNSIQVPAKTVLMLELNK